MSEEICEMERKWYLVPLLCLAAVTWFGSQMAYLESGPFDYSQILGPLTNLTAFLTVSLILLTLCMSTLFLSWKPLVSRSATLLVAFFVVLLIVVKYLIPVWDANYFQALFTDGVSKVTELQWTVMTHHTYGGFVETLDWHSGSWSFFASFLIVVFGQPTSIQAGIFATIVKWAPVGFSVLYSPIVYFLMRSYGLGHRFSLIGLFAFYAFSIWPFWLASQMLGNALYWILLAVLPRIIKGDRASLVIGFTLMVSIVTVHQGVAAFAMATLMSLLIVAIVFRFPRRALLRSASSLLFFSSVWAARIVFSIPSFAYSLLAAAQSAYTDIFGGVASIAAYSYRGYIPYQDLVHFIEGYYLAVTLIPGLILVLFAFSYRSIYLQISGGALVMTTLIVGLVAVGPAGGGAGGVDRIPSMLMPLSAFAVAYLAAKFQLGYHNSTFGASRHGPVFKFLSCALLVTLAISGTTVFFSGSNINWIPYSQTLGVNGNIGPFFECYADYPHPCTVYSINTIAALSPSYSTALVSAAYPFNPLSPPGFYTYYLTGLGSYFDLFGGNVTLLNAKIDTVLSNSNLLYETPTTVFFYKLR